MSDLFGGDQPHLSADSRWLRSFRRRYAIKVVQHARRRGIACTLSLAEYRVLVAGAACHYCGGALPPTGSGLDRIDNACGYSTDNVVPCCRGCNSERMTIPFADYEALWQVRRARLAGATNQEIASALAALTVDRPQ